ncbi:MAG: trypsin-like peptidase domain-containing protein [Pseudonocardia sp.]|nr:trypsin-like peptidase domain-containing protein [Pseudonocardia sp.]
MTLGVVAVGAAVALGGTTLGQSGLLTETVAGTATAAESPRAGTSATAPRSPDAVKTAARTTRPATSAEEVGVVDITTVLNYGEAAAAGTGVVLTSSGEILTNNHVIDGATKIKVTVVGSGASYSASVVGTDPADDVAVLRLSGASGLATAHLATAEQANAVTVGDAVTAVGNAGGTGGTPTAATGAVVALGRDITASDENGTDPEQLTGLIEVNAAVEAGDSGGPLYSNGAVIGIDTAASTSGRGRVATTAARSGSTGFAIPITTATAVAERIVAGERSDTIHQGSPAFLGVQLPDGGDGATISGVVAGSPAAIAGLRAGDTITAVDGTGIDRGTTLSDALDRHQPRDHVSISWTDTAGGSHTATVTLTAGPAD